MKYEYPTVQSVLGVQEGKRSQIKCPSGKHNDSTASLTLYADGSYYCFGCAVSGKNGMDFLVKVLRNEVRDSMAYLSRRNLLTKIE